MTSPRIPDETLNYGTWRTGERGLPYFDLTVPDSEMREAPFRHLMGTGRLSAIADRWGNVNLFTTDGGFIWFNSPSSCRTRGSVYLIAEIGGETISLLHSELTSREGIRIGTGSIEYRGELRTERVHLRIRQQFFAAPDKGQRIYARFFVTNLSPASLEARFEVRGDVTPTRSSEPPRPPHPPRIEPTSRQGWAVFANAHEQIGDIYLATPEGWPGQRHGDSLRLDRTLTLAPQAELSLPVAAGYGSDKTGKLLIPTLEENERAWAERVAPYAVQADEPWMTRECLWDAGQFLSFLSYDSSVDEYYVALGGYGWPSFGVREVAETSMVQAGCDWELAVAALRFVAKTQLASGDVPKIHTMRRDRESVEFDSDTELWFLLGACEAIAASGQTAFLDEVSSYWDKGEGTMWEHLKRAFYWVRDGIGLGANGLVLIREGDWNDYLSLMGALGCGESVMNSGMACRAFAQLAELAEQRGEKAFAKEVRQCLAGLREAVSAAFDVGWFRRGYTDGGKPVGSHAENRVFLNAQSWPVLGGCGTPEQRKLALRNAIAHCHSDIGLLLVSKPYSSPAPDDISWCAIPAGEGENAGIWPQTIHWFVWALAEEGLLDEALAEWKCGTLYAHAKRFPQVTYGIFNGPDCFSSRWAGEREGWTQTQLLDRAKTAPMNPMVAWQGFTLRKIQAAMGRLL